MEMQPKGLMPGLTALYTVLVVAAVINGVGLFQDLTSVLFYQSYSVVARSGGVNELKIIAALLFDAASFVLPVLAAKEIYNRSKRGCPLAFASAAICAARIVIIILTYEYAPVLSIVFYSAVSVSILVPVRASKRYLPGGKEQRQDELINL